MRVVDSMQVVRNRAAEALKAALHQVSQFKLKSIETNLPNPDLKVDILAQVDVHGRRHTLVCKVQASGRPDHILVALKEFQSLADRLDGNAMPVIIAPRLSDEAKALCGANKACFLDLEGNAHLELGEVFIIRSMRPRSAHTFTHDADEALAGVA